jgi:hypothetical protein
MGLIGQDCADRLLANLAQLAATIQLEEAQRVQLQCI